MEKRKVDKIVMFRRIDGYETRIVSEGWDQDLEEVCAMFRDFLAASGFSLGEGEEIGIIRNENYQQTIDNDALEQLAAKSLERIR